MNLPTQLTLLRILFAPVLVSLLFIDHLAFKIASFVVFVLASITDYYDGYAARKLGIVTVTGQFLDPLADKILVSSCLISFNVLGYIPAWMVLIIVIRDSLITGFRSYAILKGKPIVTHWLAKAKTYLQMVVLYLIFLYHLFTWPKPIPALAPALNWIREWNVLYSLLFAITVLTLATGVLYLVENRSHIRSIAVSLYRIFVPSDV
jgi:CDP-diacylglycerol--glycerol-3-phosphate 3-phosphatidyltransferase